MRSVVFPHVDKLLRLGGTAEGSLAHRPRLTHKGNNRAVSGFSGVYVQHFHAFHRLDGGNNGVDDGFIPPFAVIGNTFYKLLHRSQF